MISYGKQYIDEDDIQSVIKVLNSDWMTQGPNVSDFEDALCEKLGCNYASVVSNGTAALHLAGLALGWKPGDIILSTPLTFVASTNCVLYTGAIPDFVDIDPVSYTIDIQKLEEKIKDCLSKNKRIKAVVAVDFAGHPCDWESLRYLADKYGFQLIDDACHALGAEISSIGVCSARYADAVILSFHPVKHITTGEGGAVLTNLEKIDKKIKTQRTHGITKDEELLERNDGPWYYEMIELGFNYRLTDFQCALGISQLQKLDLFIKKRIEIAKKYDKSFCDETRFIIPKIKNNLKHVYHLYPLQIRFENLSINKRDLFIRLKEKGINAQVHYIPVHTQPYYRKHLGFKYGDYPVAEKFYEQEVSIPIYYCLSNQEVDFVVDTIKKCID